MQQPLERVEFDTPMCDLMGGAARLQYRIAEHGFVALVDVLPRMIPAGRTGDAAIVKAARVSYGLGVKTLVEDEGLIRYMMRHQHTSPFEQAVCSFHMSMPIFVARQFIRHRTASVNEVSARYTELPDKFYIPKNEDVRKQSTTNKQGGDELVEPMVATDFIRMLDTIAVESYRQYEAAVGAGVSREQARMLLPVNIYTQWYWKCDLHNILRFLSLRMDKHAQKEIRDYADAMHALLVPLFPMTFRAWDDYVRNSVTLSRLEVEALRRYMGEYTDAPVPKIDTQNKREQDEWAAKFQMFCEPPA